MDLFKAVENGVYRAIKEYLLETKVTISGEYDLSEQKSDVKEPEIRSSLFDDIPKIFPEPKNLKTVKKVAKKTRKTKKVSRKNVKSGNKTGEYGKARVKVMEILKSTKEPVTSREISKKINIPVQIISETFYRMNKENLLNRDQNGSSNRNYKYSLKNN